jgi:phosphoribosylanthranilate isomerase
VDAPRVKICGITRLEDAQLAVELGAWAVGLILAPGSPRRVRPAEAERIAGALRRRAEVAGVFVNAHLDDVARLHTRIGFTLLQLHGDEGPAYAAEAHRRLGIPVIKARAVRTRGDVQALDAFREVAFHMLDAPKDGDGGALDVEFVGERRSTVPLILAGGLTPDNVAAAAAAVHPYAVDTARGTEAEPGVKDPERMRAFFAALATAAPTPEASDRAARTPMTGDPRTRVGP